MEAAECLSFGAHRVGRNQGSTCFWGDQCSAESNCKTQTCDNTWGVGTMWRGLDSTATLGEQNFKWEKRPLESHGVVISMSKSNHQKFWFASPMLIGTLVTSVNPVKIYIYVNFNVKGLINFIT